MGAQQGQRRLLAGPRLLVLAGCRRRGYPPQGSLSAAPAARSAGLAHRPRPGRALPAWPFQDAQHAPSGPLSAATERAPPGLIRRFWTCPLTLAAQGGCGVRDKRPFFRMAAIIRLLLVLL